VRSDCPTLRRKREGWGTRRLVEGTEPKIAFIPLFTCNRQASLLKSRDLGHPLFRLPTAADPTFGPTWRDFHGCITKPSYHKLLVCYSRTIAYFYKTAMLINKRRFSAEHFHRFFRGRDSMKWNEESCRSYFGNAFGCRLSLAALA
jgi:hypothetical protein